ncbi:MAG: glycosyltransferase [Hyphomicrobiales bacterium]
MKILHLSGDYPDPVRKPTTQAIKQTVSHLKKFDHVVISMDRKSNPFKCYWVDCGKIDNAQVFAFGQWGLKFGIGLFLSFFIVAFSIHRRMKKLGYKPDLIHAHRMTFDGIAAYLLSKWWGVPYVLSVRAEVESKVFRFKPHYRWLMRKITKQAGAIYYISLFYRDKVESYAGADPAKGRAFPNIVTNAKQNIAPQAATRGFVSIFNFAIYKKKGLLGLLPAFLEASQQNPDMTLDLIGQGSANDIQQLEKLIVEHGLAGKVTIVGKVGHADLIERLPTYRAMVLPSHNETFGMVYTEALFAGVPILYSKQSGIDGYLDGIDASIGVDPNNQTEISNALQTLWTSSEALRSSIKAQSSKIFDRLDPQCHIALYEADVLSLTTKQRAAI